MTEQEATFLELVRENRGRLRRICRVYARDADAREDLHQEILLQLWRALPSYAGDSAPGTWLYRVALNTAISHARRWGVRREAPLEDVERVAASAEPAPTRRIEERRRLDLLYDAIARLAETDRAVVMLHLEERSHREIADILGTTEGNVGVKLHRIRKKLATWLEQEAMT